MFFKNWIGTENLELVSEKKKILKKEIGLELKF